MIAMASTFVEIPADRLLNRLADIGEKIKASGAGSWRWTSKGAEKVWELVVRDGITLKVYTSVAEGASEARGCGEDAIRIVVGAETSQGFRMLREGALIKRTAPNGVEDRVGTFLDRLTETLREAYSFMRRVPKCPKCSAPMAQRAGAHGEFWGCVNYPECKGTRKHEEKP